MSTADVAKAPVGIPALLREQGGWCAALGSLLYATLLNASADDYEAGGPVAAVLAGHEHDPPRTALSLRFMGAVHRLVLAGRAPTLAPFYPSVGGDATRPGAWDEFRAVVAAQRDELRALVERPVQTNEVGRCAALVGGFLTVARETALPLALLEVGTSAGLNLRWDHFRYESPRDAFGDPASPVRIVDGFSGAPPALDVPVTVTSRRGCDLAPFDPLCDDGRLTLQSYVWPDQAERWGLLRGALAIAARVPVTVERAHAVQWLGRELARDARGTARVVFHSVVLQYLTRDERDRLRATIADAGARASSDAPLAWLRLEPPGKQLLFELRLTLWPGGEERLLALAGPHGRPVEWRDERSRS